MKNIHSKRTHRWPTWPCFFSLSLYFPSFCSSSSAGFYLPSAVLDFAHSLKEISRDFGFNPFFALCTQYKSLFSFSRGLFFFFVSRVSRNC